MLSYYWRPANKGIQIDMSSKDWEMLQDAFCNRIDVYFDKELLEAMEINQKVKKELLEALEIYGSIDIFARC